MPTKHASKFRVCRLNRMHAYSAVDRRLDGEHERGLADAYLRSLLAAAALKRSLGSRPEAPPARVPDGPRRRPRAWQPRRLSTRGRQRQYGVRPA